MAEKGKEFTHFGKNIEKTPFFEGVEMLHYTDIRFGSFLLHDHDCIEIMLILDGDVELAIEGERYQLPRGCMVIIPPQSVHRTIIPKGTRRYERIVLHLFPQYINLIANGLLSTAIHFDFMSHAIIVEYSPETFWIFRTIFERFIHANCQVSDYRRMVTPSLVIELFMEVEYILKDKTAWPVPATNTLVSAVVDYIDKHFMEQGLTVEQIRESVYVSQGYLSRIFKSYTGSSIYNFLTYKRLIHAKELLVSGETVLNTCMLSGFTDYTSFLKTFKNVFKMTPTQYRSRYFKLQSEGLSEFGGTFLPGSGIKFEDMKES